MRGRLSHFHKTKAKPLRRGKNLSKFKGKENRRKRSTLSSVLELIFWKQASLVKFNNCIILHVIFDILLI